MVPAVPATALLGDTFWVDPYFGSDATGTGSSGAPFKTITHAMTHARALDDIVLRDGVYSLTSGEVLPIAVGPGVTVRAEHPRGAFIDGEDEVPLFDMLDPGPHTGLSGLVIMNGYGGTGAGLKIRRYTASAASDAGWPRILDCWFYRCTGATAGGASM